MSQHRSLSSRAARAASTLPNTAGPSRESGSAYVLTLMVLVILSLLGLVLALITQSEVEIGANERVVNRVFYGAEAGISAAVTNLLVANGIAGLKLETMDPGSSINGTRVQVSPFIQLNAGPAELSQINQDTDYKAVTYGVNATAIRFGKDGAGGETIFGSKSLELMITVTPFEEVLATKEFKESSRYKRP
jgi:hypothetical protein